MGVVGGLRGRGGEEMAEVGCKEWMGAKIRIWFMGCCLDWMGVVWTVTYLRSLGCEGCLLA